MESERIERLAEYLCSEFDFSLNPCVGYSWPEHENDDGYRGDGSFVKLQPSDVQAYARENAKRILAFLEREAALTAAEPAAVWQWRSRIKGGAWDAWENGRYGQEAPPFMEVQERKIAAQQQRAPACGAKDFAQTREACHPDDVAVDRFAAAMKAKLAKKRAEGRGGWDNKDDCSQLFLTSLLREHVEKGDPVDVGNLAMMLHQRGERILSLLLTIQGE